jgi:peptidoglycan hydrolase-like protein with peptidoglycan-binding domain
MQFVLASAMAAAVALCCMLSFAPHARAATLTSDQLQNVQQLLQSYGVSDAKINAVTAVLSDNGMHMGSSTASSTNCAAPVRALVRGMRSEDVKTLQERLVDDGYLSEDNATGYFGSSTEGALKAWQADQGIVASGTPETTGWGAVGKKTLRAFATCELHKVENRLEHGTASSTPGMEPMHNERGDGRPPMPPMPPSTVGSSTQSNAVDVGQFLSDYSDAFNQNLAAVATAPYQFYVPMVSDFFVALGIN